MAMGATAAGDGGGGDDGSGAGRSSRMATVTLEGRGREMVGARMLVEAQEVTGSQNASSSSSSSPAGAATAAGVGAGEVGCGGGAGSVGEGGGGGGGGGSSSSDSAAAAPASSSSYLELLVPKRVLGYIIGKSGKYINAVRATTGCEIKVDDKSSEQQVVVTFFLKEVIRFVDVCGSRVIVDAHVMCVSSVRSLVNMMVGHPETDYHCKHWILCLVCLLPVCIIKSLAINP
jgi:predicted RNA-binding protein YlqC (UPF0109 family)